MGIQGYENEDDMFITLEMEDGSEEECVVLDIFEVNGKEYIALAPAEPDEDEEESDVYFYAYAEDGDGEPILSDIEDDDEFEAVCDRFDEILDEDDYEEEYAKEKGWRSYWKH